MKGACACAFVAVLQLCSPGLAVETNEMVESAKVFFDRQLGKFPLPGDYPPGYEQAQLIQTYDLVPGGGHPLTYWADTYDAATAMILYTEMGHMQDAQAIADGFRLVQSKDPFADGRVRSRYWANDLLAPDNSEPSISSPDARVGDISWAGIALTRFGDAAVRRAFLTSQQAEPYLESARRMARWIDGSLKQDEPFGGYSMGKDGTDQFLFGTPHARSTEFNVDAYVLARNLEHLDPANPTEWQEMAAHAQGFVQAMYQPGSVPGTGWYWIGTKDDGGVPIIDMDLTHIPADGQTWTALSGIDSNDRRTATLNFVRDTTLPEPDLLVVDDYPSDPRSYRGVRWTTESLQHTHVRSEATAGYVLAMLVGVHEGWIEESEWRVEIDDVFANLDSIRLTAEGADPDGIGMVSTSWPDGDGDGTPNLRHVASTGWTGLADRYALGFLDSNPLAQVPEPSSLTLRLAACGLLICLRRRRCRPGHRWAPRS